MRIHVVPNKAQLPQYGGVREHMLQLFKCMAKRSDIHFVLGPKQADIVHVESSFQSYGKVDVYVCHGGFVPEPIPVVLDNLQRATVIVSVSEWVARTYFPTLLHKTIVIPNGVDLSEWEGDPIAASSDYVLYAKQWTYHMDDFVWLADQCPETKFVTTVWPYVTVPANVQVIGLQTRNDMSELLHNARFLMLSGSEVCPTMLLEAWACGTPVLAKEGSGAEELMRYGSPCDGLGKPIAQGGVLYRDCSDLMSAASTLTVSREYEGRRGFRKATRFFQWDGLFAKYYQTYQAIIEGRTAEYLARNSVAARSQTLFC